ncbi:MULTISPECIES: alpha/beta hydrolase [Arthrobacter]|uniref:Alpha/beta hydrolase n=2 Tax=Arthrobacter TaxID=1663 RepID=A0ABU9KJD9_9MICC|nr:alpha/beta hydrolase [Arthrobacter sp. YJM1]MDP5225703.1 alpha/beta hydrolase [Arthrobacter sp. YJM1]
MDRPGSADFMHLQRQALASYGVEATSRYLTLGSPPLRAHVLEAGRGGKAVLLVHGGNSSSASWLPLLPGRVDHFSLHLVDRPGCGLTGPFDYRGVDLKAHGAGFLKHVCDGLGLGPVSIVGNSMGGYFALCLALAHPEYVKKLVLLGEPAGSSPTAGRFHRMVGTRGLNSLLYATALRPPHDAAGVRASWRKARLVTHPERVPEELGDCLAAGSRLPGASRSWTTMVEQVFVPPGRGLMARDLIATYALRPELSRITAPALFLWGRQDPLGPPEAGQALASLMPHARLQVVEDAGHLPWIDQPDVCTEAVTAFLTD